MTFVPLTYKNFVVNKVKNTISVAYKHSDLNTHICNKSIQSKSLINTNNYVNLTNEECGLSSGDVNLLSKKNKISTFYSMISDKDLSANDYFNVKRILLDNSNILNESLKDYNFKNYFSVERIEQKFLPNSFELQKKNIVNNNLYYDYKSNYSLDFYRNLKKGFCNYNTINFFSQQYDNNKNHTNCVIWPNPISEAGNLYDFYNKSFTFSTYLNLRKNYSKAKQPECLVHIPELFSLYIVKSIDSSDHRICMVAGTNSKNKLKTLNSTIFNVSSRNINAGLSTYISSDLTIINNTWYNVAINFNKNVDDSRDIEIYIDGVSIDKFSLNFDREDNIDNNSFVCLGNKPDYYDTVNQSFNTNYDKIFYEFFGSKFSEVNPVSGPFIKKDISLGRNTKWVDTGQFAIESVVNQNEGVKFEELKSLESESFHGELHDIRFYLQSLSEEKILENCSKSIENIANEISSFDLCFFVPVFYLPVYCKKQTIVNGNSQTMNTYFSNPYNPYFSNFCGGLEMSAESFLIDFVNLTKPNIVIGGKEYTNIYGDNSNTSITSLVSSTSDVLQIKKGVLFKTIYNKNLNDETHASFDSNMTNNLSYRNLLILPNDNGIPSIKFDVITEVLQDLTHNSNSIDSENVYHINTNDLLVKEDYTSNINYNLINDNNNISFDIALQNNSSFSFDFTNDVFYNLSNIIYHDSRIQSIENLSIQDDIFINKLDAVNNILTVTQSNPVLRNYKQDPNTFNTLNLDIIHEHETYDQSNNIRYLKLPIPYASVNIDFDCIFSTIFDVSSKLYNKKINKNTFKLSDNDLITTNKNVSITLEDDGYGSLYRSDCLSKKAKWSYLGNIFYKEGILSINRPELSYFGENDYDIQFESDFSMFVHEINIPAESGTLNKSVNATYNEDLRHDESAFNSESSFVYITDINLHDENLNIIAKAKLARPAPKKNEDNILFKLKMDY